MNDDQKELHQLLDEIYSGEGHLELPEEVKHYNHSIDTSVIPMWCRNCDVAVVVYSEETVIDNERTVAQYTDELIKNMKSSK